MISLRRFVGDPRGSRRAIPVQSWAIRDAGVDHGDKRIERAHSIVSSPYEEGLEFFIELVPQGKLTPQEYDLFKIGWSHLGNPGIVVGTETRFLLQDMNLAFHLRHLVV